MIQKPKNLLELVHYQIQLRHWRNRTDDLVFNGKTKRSMYKGQKYVKFTMPCRHMTGCVRQFSGSGRKEDSLSRGVSGRGKLLVVFNDIKNKIELKTQNKQPLVANEGHYPRSQFFRNSLGDFPNSRANSRLK